jgi:hypothetical protein
MARTFAQIEEAILTAKTADANLSALTSTSKTAVWRLWVKIVAAAILMIELLWDQKKKELDEAADSAIAGNDKWYADRVLEWQYGYSLTVTKSGKLVYLIDDPDARLVKKVSSLTLGRTLRIKVAKASGDNLIPLTAGEKVSLETYIKDIKFAGTEHLLTSTNADLVKLQVSQVYFDGKLDPDTFKTAFELALNNYLKNIYYNGLFNINDFRDAGEAVPGCKDFQISWVEIKPATGAYAIVNLDYNPVSGYFKIDPAYALADQITYIPV